MPNYEYLCDKGHITEVITTSYDLKDYPCSECNEKTVRIISRNGTFLMNPEDRGG